jgi:hypothetical protein
MARNEATSSIMTTSNAVVVAERSEAVNTASTLSSFHNIVERSETVVDIFVKIVDCRVFIFDRASHYGFNGGIIEKSSGHFLTALFVDPLFSQANGQFFISTRRWRAYRGLLPIAFDRARHSASNGRSIVDFGLSQHRHF